MGCHAGSKRPLSPTSPDVLERFNSAWVPEWRQQQQRATRTNPEEFVKRARALTVEFDAITQRENGLAPEERLREDGEILLNLLKSSPHTVLLLQPTSQSDPCKARCRAAGCLYGSTDGLYAAEILDKYRISLERGQGLQPEYYHLRCMEGMVPLPALARSQFQFDGQTALNSWSLMIGKWMEHQGRIDMEKIASYIERERAYRQWLSDNFTEISDIELQHQFSCSTEYGFCQCPPFPKGPKMPVLKEYITSENDVCGLWDVVCHPRGDASIAFLDDNPPWAGVPLNELEL